MSKTIPLALKEHLAQPATTLCLLQKIGPLPNGTFITLTSLDVDVVYDDGDGERTYYASTGMDLSAVAASNDLGVDNAETSSLAPVFPAQGITVEMIDRGDLDAAPFVIYRVNYRDLGEGHEIMGGGTIGEVRITEGGMVTFENRSLSQLLKQNSVCERDSLTCRVRKFGSQPGEERFPCMYDVSGEWVSGQVTEVGEEPVRDFFTNLSAGDDFFAPGLILFETGDNAGMSREVETYSGPNSGADAYISLGFTTRFPVKVGDTFQIRRDCTRQWEGHNSCQTYNNRQWFRGEPFIPVSNTVPLSTPRS